MFGQSLYKDTVSFVYIDAELTRIVSTHDAFYLVLLDLHVFVELLLMFSNRMGNNLKNQVVIL